MTAGLSDGRAVALPARSRATDQLDAVRPSGGTASSVVTELEPERCVEVVRQLHGLMDAAFPGETIVLTDAAKGATWLPTKGAAGCEVIVRTTAAAKEVARYAAGGAHTVVAVAPLPGGSEVQVHVASGDPTTRGLAETVAKALVVCAGLDAVASSDASARESALREAFVVDIRAPDIVPPDNGPDDGFVARLCRWALERPDRIAVRDATSHITYAELDSQSRGLAAELERRGVRRGSRVMIVAARRPELVPCFVAPLRLGASVSVVDPRNPDQWLAECESLVRPAVVLGLAEGSARLDFSAPVLDRVTIEEALHDPAQATESAGAGGDVLGPDDEAIITFTSGTTGTPKAVAGRYGSLTHFFDWMDAAFGPLRGASFGMCSSLAHDPLQRDIMTPLFLGGTCVVPPDEVIARPSLLGAWLVQERIAVVCLNPVLVPFLTTVARTFDDLRLYLSVGAPLPRDHATAIRRACPTARVLNLYGSTESQRAVAYFELPEDLEDVERLPHVLPLGQGMVDVEVSVTSSVTRAACLPYEVGEVMLTSDYLSLGYLVDDHLVRTRFREEVRGGRLQTSYLTGDLGFHTPDLGVVGRGRVDEQVKIAGHRVEPSAVDSASRQHPVVTEAATVAIDIDGVATLVTFVVVDDERDVLPPDEVRRFIADRLPAAAVPTVVFRLPALPLTANGKVDRGVLRSRAEGLLNASRKPSDALATLVHRHTGPSAGRGDVPLKDMGIDSLRFEVLLTELSHHYPVERTLGLRNMMTLDDLRAQLTGTGEASGSRPVDISYGIRTTTTDVPAVEPASQLGEISAVSTTSITVDGQRLHHLCSNDYLGLGARYGRSDVLEEFLRTGLPLHSHGSLSVNSELGLHRELVDGLAALHNCEGVALYSSAYLANLAALTAIAGRGDELFIDESAHRSLLEGARLSGARLHVFRHNDTDHLKYLVASTVVGPGRRVITTEGLFSVEGDLPDLEGIAGISDRYDCVVVVDEACSVGQVGHSGRGLGEHFADAAHCIDVRTGTLAKALGSSGGYVAGPAALVDELRRTGGAAFSTGLAPISAFVAAKAVRGMLSDEAGRVHEMRRRARRWRELLCAEGLDTGRAQAGIVPIAVPEGDVTRAHAALVGEGSYAMPLRPPWSATPALRTSITVDHDIALLPAFAAAIARSVRASCDGQTRDAR